MGMASARKESRFDKIKVLCDFGKILCELYQIFSESNADSADSQNLCRI